MATQDYAPTEHTRVNRSRYRAARELEQQYSNLWAVGESCLIWKVGKQKGWGTWQWAVVKNILRGGHYRIIFIDNTDRIKIVGSEQEVEYSVMMKHKPGYTISSYKNDGASFPPNYGLLLPQQKYNQH